MNEKLTIERVSYNNPKDERILKSCLENWFQNPKDLNLTSPTMRYPFNYNQWTKNSYDNHKTITYVLKKNGWIIGHISLNIREEKKWVHIFHVFVDRNYRGKGYGKLLVEKAIAYAKENSFNTISLFVLPKNEPALNLYLSFGFTKSAELSPTGSPKYLLEIKN